MVVYHHILWACPSTYWERVPAPTVNVFQHLLWSCSSTYCEHVATPMMSVWQHLLGITANLLQFPTGNEYLKQPLQIVQITHQSPIEQFLRKILTFNSYYAGNRFLKLEKSINLLAGLCGKKIWDLISGFHGKTWVKQGKKLGIEKYWEKHNINRNVRLFDVIIKRLLFKDSMQIIIMEHNIKIKIFKYLFLKQWKITYDSRKIIIVSYKYMGFLMKFWKCNSINTLMVANS